MKTIQINPPPNTSITVYSTLVDLINVPEYAITSLANASPALITAWQLPEEGYGGIVYSGKYMIFEQTKFLQIELGVIYPAKGGGSFHIALVPYSRAGGAESLFVLDGYSDAKLEWCNTTLSLLSSFYSLPKGAGGYAHDC